MFTLSYEALDNLYCNQPISSNTPKILTMNKWVSYDSANISANGTYSISGAPKRTKITWKPRVETSSVTHSRKSCDSYYKIKTISKIG